MKVMKPFEVYSSFFTVCSLVPQAMLTPTYRMDHLSKDRVLMHGTIAEHSGMDITRCMNACNVDHCKSFSFSAKEKQCHLSSAKRGGHTMEYLEKSGFVYYEKN